MLKKEYALPIVSLVVAIATLIFVLDNHQKQKALYLEIKKLNAETASLNSQTVQLNKETAMLSVK